MPTIQTKKRQKMHFQTEYKNPAIVEFLRGIDEDELAKLLGIEKQVKNFELKSEKKSNILDELLANPLDVKFSPFTREETHKR